MEPTTTSPRLVSDDRSVTAELVDSNPERWTISGRHGLYSRAQVQTAMDIATLRSRATPGASDTLMVEALERELLVPVLPTDPWALLETLIGATASAAALPDTSESFRTQVDSSLVTALTRQSKAVRNLAALTRWCSAASLDHPYAEGEEDLAGRARRQSGHAAERAAKLLDLAAEELTLAYLHAIEVRSLEQAAQPRTSATS